MRRGGAEDVAAMAALDALASPYPWRASQLAEVVANSGTVLLAGELTELEGFVLYSSVLDEATILNIAVHPDCRGQGLGRRLLESAVQCMREAGVRRCMLEVRASNETARRLYRRAGFEQDAVRRDYYPTSEGREDALLLSRQL